MACTPRGQAWWDGVRLVLRRPETTLLAFLGLAVLCAGVVVDRGDVLWGGVGIVMVGILLSVLEGFGIGGVKATLRKPAASAFDYPSFVRAQEESLLRLADELGAGAEAAVVVEDATGDAAVHWDKGVETFRTHVLCLIVHRVLGHEREGDAYRRAVAVLRSRGLDDRTVAAVLDVKGPLPS